MPEACRRRAEALFELARKTQDGLERLAHVLNALEWEDRAKILEEVALKRIVPPTPASSPDSLGSATHKKEGPT